MICVLTQNDLEFVMQALEQEKLDIILKDFIFECKTTFKDLLYDVRLFGSYARGDYNKDSDIDVMVILDMDEINVKKSRHEVSRIAAMLELKYNVYLSPVIYGKDEYNTRKSFGFCKNVDKEGVSRYAGQAYA